MTPDEERRKKETLDYVMALTDHCDICNKSGQVTIYHRLYRGSPWVDLQRRNGTTYKFHARAVAFCSCAVGDWYRLHNSEHDPRPRLNDVLARSGWSRVNPLTPDLQPDVACGNWRNWWRWLKSVFRGKSITQPIPKQPARAEPRGDPVLIAAGHPAAQDEPGSNG